MQMRKQHTCHVEHAHTDQDDTAVHQVAHTLQQTQKDSDCQDTCDTAHGLASLVMQPSLGTGPLDHANNHSICCILQFITSSLCTYAAQHVLD